MGFFSAVGQVVSNGKNFKEWEKNDANKSKQREALAQKGIDPAALQKAGAKGKVIMDVIDIMDTHSEEVAENTETAIMPFAQLAPMLTGLAAAFGLGKFAIMPAAKKYDKAYGEFRKAHGDELQKMAKELAEKIANSPQNKKLAKIKMTYPGEPLFIGTNLGKISQEIKKLSNNNFKYNPLAYYDPASLFHKKNMEVLKGSSDKSVKDIYKRLGELSKEYHNTPGIKNFKKNMGRYGGILGGVIVGTFILSNILAAKIQVRSSRIARWQSRQDLADPKYFVQYTDEQVQAAKNSIEQNSDKDENKFSLPFFKKGKKSGLKYGDNQGFFSSLKNTIADNKKYNEWKDNNKLEDKKIKRNLTPEELKEAEREQEVIQRVTKLINNQAEEYSENMETAAGVLIGGTPFLGAAVGGLISALVNKTGLGDKIADRSLNKILKSIDDKAKKDEVKKLYENLKPAAEDGKEFWASKLAKFNEFFTKAWDASGPKGDTAKKMGRMEAIMTNGKKMINIMSTSSRARNIMIGGIGTFVTGMAGAFIGLKLQKSAARAGRYKAKRELEQNPANFVGYTKEEFKTVDDIKAEKKSALSKFKEYMLFIPNVIKDYCSYEKYKKTKAKQDKELLNELVKQNVSDEQLKEAKDLQRKLFTTFESVDDKSQEYSESIEAINEMSQPVIPYLGIAAIASPFVIAGVKLAKGGGAKAAETLTGFFAKHTGFLKGKMMRKYFDEVASNITNTVANQHNIDEKISKNAFLKLVKILPENINIAQLSGEFQKTLKSVKGKDNELEALLIKLSKNKAFKNVKIKDIYGMIDTIGDGKSAKMMKDIAGIDIDTKDLQALKDAIKAYAGDKDNLGDILAKFVKNANIPKTKISDIEDMFNIMNTPELQKVFGGVKGKVDVKKLQKAIKSANISGYANAYVEGTIKNGKWRKYAEKLKDSFPEYGWANNMLDSLLSSSLTDEQALKIYKNMQIICQNVPSEDLKKITDTMLKEFRKNPEQFIQALKDGSFRSIFMTNGLTKTIGIATGTWTSIGLVMTFALESIFADMQKKAGRLGVMKALEELKDVEYYANEMPENPVKPLQSNNAAASNTFTAGKNTNFSDFLNKTRK